MVGIGQSGQIPLRLSSPTSSTKLLPWPPPGSTHTYPPSGWGDGMASHDAITDGDQPTTLAAARVGPRVGRSQSVVARSLFSTTDTDRSVVSSTFSGHAVPQWLFDKRVYMPFSYLGPSSSDACGEYTVTLAASTLSMSQTYPQWHSEPNITRIITRRPPAS